MGRKGDIWENLDSEYFLISNLFRWKNSDISEIDYSKLPYHLQIGIRRLKELRENERGI